jgi:hypothetical protein
MEVSYVSSCRRPVNGSWTANDLIDSYGANVGRLEKSVV